MCCRQHVPVVSEYPGNMASGADAGLRMTVRKKNKTDMQEMKRHVSVRPARKSDAADIARLVVMAWPVEAFLAHGHGQTVDDLIDLVADMAAREDTLYSYRNTVVAELAPGGAGADSTIREGLPEETRVRDSKANEEYYLLRNTEVPAIILECGFLSCPEELSLLMDQDYQEQFCKAAARGILACMGK